MLPHAAYELRFAYVVACCSPCLLLLVVGQVETTLTNCYMCSAKLEKHRITQRKRWMAMGIWQTEIENYLKIAEG